MPSVEARTDRSADPRIVCHLIVGVSRGGTTWLSKCLNEHPEAACFGETAFWGRHHIAPGPDGAYDLTAVQRVLDKQRHNRLGPRGEGPGCLTSRTISNLPRLIDQAFEPLNAPVKPGEVFRALCGAIGRAEGKAVVIEKTPHHLHFIERIARELPDARFVVMFREPYGFMLSYKFQGKQKSQRVRSIFARIYHPLVSALVWRGYALHAAAATSRYPHRVCRVTLDQIKQDTAGVLEQVQRFLGLAPCDLAAAVAPDNSSFPEGERPELGPEDIFWMNLVAGRQIAAAGYPKRPVPFAPLRIGWSIVRLPLWGARNLAFLRSRVEGSFVRYVLTWLRRG